MPCYDSRSETVDAAELEELKTGARMLCALTKDWVRRWKPSSVSVFPSHEIAMLRWFISHRKRDSDRLPAADESGRREADSDIFAATEILELLEATL